MYKLYCVCARCKSEWVYACFLFFRLEIHRWFDIPKRKVFSQLVILEVLFNNTLVSPSTKISLFHYLFHSFFPFLLLYLLLLSLLFISLHFDGIQYIKMVMYNKRQANKTRLFTKYFRFKVNFHLNTRQFPAEVFFLSLLLFFGWLLLLIPCAYRRKNKARKK